jgi:transmembrane sensor
VSKVHRIPDVKEVEREASAWIARLNADDVTPEDRAHFEAWLARHPLHARDFEELSGIWAELVNAGPWVRAVSFAQSMNDAAAIVAAVGVSGALSWKSWVSRDLYSTAVGEQTTVSLPDGSTLELNSNSTASVDFSKATRIIRLERGEAFFRVAHDKERPFWVVGGGSWVRAVGTAFNVYLRPDDVRVTVSEGTVRVGSAQALAGGAPSETALAATPAAVLTSGEQADLHGSATATRKLSPAEVQRSVTWREGTVYFENQPLSEVVVELSRYSTVHVVVEDEHVGHLPVAGTFQAGPQGMEALLTTLEQGFGLTVHRESGRVVIEEAQDSPPH